MPPQVKEEMWEEETPVVNRKTVVTKVMIVTAVVAVTTMALYSLSAVSPAQVETALNARSNAVGDDLTRATSDCACAGTCSAIAGGDGLHRCTVSKKNCIGIDYKPATVAAGVKTDADCLTGGKANGKCTAVCEFIQGRYDCWNFPCLNGGFCTDGVADKLNSGYTCHCAFGYTGTNCELDIDECGDGYGSPDYPCHKRSLCTNTDGSYSCECRTGWEGDGYIVDHADNCSREKAKCKSKDTRVKLPSWLARKTADEKKDAGCQDINDCASSPCKHESKCTNLIATDYKPHGYTCTCTKTHLNKFGWDGKECQNDINECALIGKKKNPANDCDPEAECTNTDGSFTCGCKPHWTSYDKLKVNHFGHNGRYKSSQGDRGCFDHDDCASKPCKHGATCHEGPDGCKVPGKCSIVRKAPEPPIQSKLECTKAAGKWLTGPGISTFVPCFWCTCAPGWSGYTCENDEDECAKDAASRSDLGKYPTPMNDCDPNALCTNLPGTYQCACNLGWTGTSVTKAKGTAPERGHFPYNDKSKQKGCWDANDCEYNPCAHGGTCTDCGTLCIECECVPGWRGTTCGVDWNECLMGIHRCSNDATCVNTPGSYACKCDLGYTGDGIGNAVEELKVKFTVNGVQKTKEVIHGCKDINDCTHNHKYILYPKREKRVVVQHPPTCTAKAVTPANAAKQAANAATCGKVRAFSLKLACRANAKCEFDVEDRKCHPKKKNVKADEIACKAIRASTLKTNCAKFPVCKYEKKPDSSKMVPEGEGPCIHGSCTPGNGPMAYACTCKPGWIDTNCDSNENECMRETSCHRFADCTDEEGTYSCKCKPGYVGDGKNCVDENDCKGQCKHGFCTDLGIMDFRCNCNTGWEDKLCDSDINECAEFTHGCGANAICTNHLALIKLEPEQEAIVGTEKFTETQMGTADGKGYSCACDVGFDGEPYKPGTCTDIDDCKVKTLGQKCKNGVCRDMGANTYECICNKGWQDFNCDYDINECYTGDHKCVKEARCVNTPGTYNCRCLSGYGGDGFMAEHSKSKGGERQIHFANGTKLSVTTESGAGCHDLNDCVPEKCETKHGECHDRGPNKYECVCHDGWGCNPNPKEKTCKIDCNECAEGFGYPKKNSCAKGGRSDCENNPDGEGGYKCTCRYPSVESPGDPNGKGWFGDGETCTPCQICEAGYTPSGKCEEEQRLCNNKDECDLSLHNCDAMANCADTDGSFLCECKQDGTVTKGWLGVGRTNEWYGQGVEKTCKRCTRCYPGYREVSPCTSTSDRICKPYIPTGLYMMESEADDNRECIRLDPKLWYPTRFDAGNGDKFCGLKGGKKAVSQDTTLTWRFTQLSVNTQLWKGKQPEEVNTMPVETKQISDLYTIESQADKGKWKCLFFGDKGRDMYPSLQNCKDGESDCPWERKGAAKPHCGFVDRASLIRNRQAIWKITPIKFTERKYILQNRMPKDKNGAKLWKCLVFEKNGGATNPSRYNWGNGNDFCGAGDWEGLGHKVALMTNKQAIFIITSLQ